MLFHVNLKMNAQFSYWKTFKYICNNVYVNLYFGARNFMKYKQRSSIADENLAYEFKYIKDTADFDNLVQKECKRLY